MPLLIGQKEKANWPIQCGHPVLNKDGNLVDVIDDLATELELQKLVTDIEDEKIKGILGE